MELRAHGWAESAGSAHSPVRGGPPPLLPSVGGEEQVDGGVVQLSLAGQVLVDDDAEGGGAVGEAP